MLPILQHRAKIESALRSHPVVILVAETGSGKSTQIGQILLDMGETAVVTQPRRLPTVAIAMRVAAEVGCEVGTTVGYRIGGVRQATNQTDLLFATDGLTLVREVMQQNDFSYLCIDEVHEWGANVEALLAWAKYQMAHDGGFRLVVMSATLDAEPLAEWFGSDAVVVKVPGRKYPVERRQSSRSTAEEAVDYLMAGRDVLVLEPGKEEIRRTIVAIQQLHSGAVVLPLHAELTPDEQNACLEDYGVPKCVVSSPVAQTSLTLPGVVVVDSGLERQQCVDTSAGEDGYGVETLRLVNCAQDTIFQRIGRSGRTGPGEYVLCSDVTLEERSEYGTPEIQRSLLESVMLRFRLAGMHMEEMDFFHEPGSVDVQQAKRLLITLGALDTEGQLTDIGRRMALLPVGARTARMLIEAERLGVLDDMATAAAIIEQEGIVDRHTLVWRKLCEEEQDSDVLAQLAVYSAACGQKADKIRELGVHVKSFRDAQVRRKRIAGAMQMGRGTNKSLSSSQRRKALVRSIAAGMVDQLHRVDYYGVCSQGSSWRQMSRTSVIRGEGWVVGKPRNLPGRRGTVRLLTMATRVETQWLMELAPQLVTRSIGLNPRYDLANDVVVSTTIIFFNGTLVQEEEVIDTEHPQAAAVFAAWLAGQKSADDVALDVVLRANAGRQEQAQELNTRAAQNVFTVYTSAELAEWYVVALSGAKRLAEVNNPEALILPALDEALVSRTITDNPDTISVLGRELQLRYRWDGNAVRLLLPDELVANNRWCELPDGGVRLPGGRFVEVGVPCGYTVLYGSNIPELKEEVREHLNARQWDGWTNKPEIAVPDIEDENSEIPLITIAYGRCVVTGQELVAYGTLEFNPRRWYAGDPWFLTTWYRKRPEAERVQGVAKLKLEEIWAAMRQKRELEAAKANAEAARSKLSGLTLRQGWHELDAELRYRVGNHQRWYLPPSTDWEKDRQGTEALIVEVLAALGDVEAQEQRLADSMQTARLLRNEINALSNDHWDNLDGRLRKSLLNLDVDDDVLPSDISGLETWISRAREVIAKVREFLDKPASRIVESASPDALAELAKHFGSKQ